MPSTGPGMKKNKVFTRERYRLRRPGRNHVFLRLIFVSGSNAPSHALCCKMALSNVRREMFTVI